MIGYLWRLQYTINKPYCFLLYSDWQRVCIFEKYLIESAWFIAMRSFQRIYHSIAANSHYKFLINKIISSFNQTLSNTFCVLIRLPDFKYSQIRHIYLYCFILIPNKAKRRYIMQVWDFMYSVHSNRFSCEMSLIRFMWAILHFQYECDGTAPR